MKRHLGRKGGGSKAESVGRRAGGGWGPGGGGGRTSHLHHRLRNGSSPKGGGHILSRPTKDQLRISYSSKDIDETEGGIS